MRQEKTENITDRKNTEFSFALLVVACAAPVCHRHVAVEPWRAKVGMLIVAGKGGMMMAGAGTLGLRELPARAANHNRERARVANHNMERALRAGPEQDGTAHQSKCGGRSTHLALTQDVL